MCGFVGCIHELEIEPSEKLKDTFHDMNSIITHTNIEIIIQLLNDHCKGKADYSRKIWTVLIFMIWH